MSMRNRHWKPLFGLVYGSFLTYLPGHRLINRLRGKVAGWFMSSCGGNVRIGPRVHISNPHNITLGDNIVINAGCYLVAGLSPVVIGDDTSLAPRCFIETMNHNFDDPEQLIRLQGRTEKPVTIGKDCWLAYGVVVLPGCTVGDGAVVGASSVVTKDIPPYTVNGGIPACFIRKRGMKENGEQEGKAG